MNWLNLRTSQLREPAFIGSEPVARATWLCVMAYCVELENGGRIAGARLWKDRQWQQTCGVMLSEVQSCPLLLTWEGDDLVVWNYPTDKEVEVRTRRDVAKENGKRGGRPTKTDPTEKITHEKPTLVSGNNQRCKAEGEREGEGKENLPAGGEPAAPKVRKEADGPNADFIRRWVAEFPKHHGDEEYLFQGAKDGAQVSRLLKSCGKTPEELQRVFVAAWKRPDLFNCKAAASIAGFVGRYNEIIAELNSLKRAPELLTPAAFRAPMNPPPKPPPHIQQ